MSQLFGAPGEPRTIVVPVDGEQIAHYTLAPGLFQYVQSVLIQVDNSGGGAARPTLRVKEQSGVVIAAKRQGESIPAGDSGTATWALRLTDEQEQTAGGGVNPYVKHAPTCVIPNGTDPTVTGVFHVSMPTDPIPGDGDLSIAFGQGQVRIDTTPGVTGTGLHGVYNLGPFVFPTGSFGFTNGAIGSGFTAPGGVPYPCIVTQGFGDFGNGSLKVCGVAETDAAQYDYFARPDWPAAYGAGDVLFEGIWNVPVRVD